MALSKGTGIPLRPAANRAQIQRAREVYESDDVEIDDDAVLSETDDGAWISAWVWLPGDEEDAVESTSRVLDRAKRGDLFS